MTKMTRHVGKMKQTDTRCVVVMMQIPGREDHALVVEPDSLPEHYHQNVMKALESKEGQANTDFANELGRRQMYITNRGNMSIMQALHEAKFLRPAHIDNVLMTPTPGSAYPLRQILDGMGKTTPDSAETTVLQGKGDPNNVRFNPHEYNQDVKSTEEKLGTARGIITQAEIMEQDAARLRNQAYALAPELRPVSKVSATTELTEEAPAEAPKKRGRGRPKGSTKKTANS